MTWTLFPWKRAAKRLTRRAKKKTYYPTFEQLEVRWLPSTISLGLTNDTSGGLKITSDDHLNGSISDSPFSVSGKIITLSGGISGTATTDSGGNYTYNPGTLADVAYNNTTAKFTNGMSQQITSSSLSFTVDTTAPAVTLTAPSSTNTGAFYVKVSATDANSIPDGTVVHLDIDLNNNGSFADAGETNYCTGTTTSGVAQFKVNAALSAGTYPIRARLNDKAGNQGTSSTKTAVVTASPTTWTLTGQQRTTEPVQATTVPFGRALISPNDGSFRIFEPLDFDLSPGTSVGGSPALVFNSGTVAPQPILEGSLVSDSGGSVPSEIDAQLTWNNGAPGSWITFTTTGHSAGDTYVMAAQVPSAVSGTGAYPWSLYISSKFASAAPIDRVITGTAYVVDNGGLNPFTAGWSIAGVDQLVSVSGGMLYVFGSGGTRFYAGGGGTYTSPDSDYGGTLVKNGDNTYTFTDKFQNVRNFDTSGNQSTVVDPAANKITYTLSSGRLDHVTSPDGGVATITYGQDMQSHWRISSISEPGSRSISPIRNTNNNITSITEANGALDTFTYSANAMTTLKVTPLNETYTYDGITNLLSSIDRGSGTTLNLAPAAAMGLATTPAKNGPAVAVITDALSQLTTYTLDGLARESKIQTPDGGTTNWTLDSHGQPTVFKDALNQTTSYVYSYGSGKGDMTQVTNPDGSLETFAYDGTFHKVTSAQDTLNDRSTMTYDASTGDLLTVKNALGQIVSMTYATGLLQTVKDTLGNVTSFAYDANRRLQKTTNALGGVDTVTYDSSGNPQTDKDQLGHTTTLSFDANNQLTQITDALGGVWQTTYDYAGLVTSKIDALTHTTNITYDTRGWPTVQTNAYNNPLAQPTTSTYDALGRELTVTDANNHTSTMTYDAMGRMLTRKSPVGAVETFTYDLGGQLLTYTDGLGHTTSYTLNNRGWITAVKDPLARVLTSVYDTEGNMTVSVDPLGNRTSYTYDVLNRLIQVQDALTNLSTIVYDADGNVSATVDALGNRTTTTFDALNRPTGVTNALNHTVTSSYDAVGNVTKITDAVNNVSTLTYDALNRLTAFQDPGAGIATTVYDAVGNIVNTIDPLTHKSTFVFDALNRQTSATDALAGVTTTVYDSVGNVVNIIDSVGNKTTFVFDAANRETQMTDPLGNSVTYAYDLANRETSETDRLGRRIDFTYDNANRQTAQTWVSGGVTVNNVTFTYDAADNQLTAANNNGTYTMTYDALHQVTVANEPFGLTLTSTYDADRNRTVRNDNFAGVLTSTYDAANRLTLRKFGGALQTPLRLDLTYTAADQISTITRYSDLGGTMKIGSSSYTYDAVGRISNLQHFNGSATSLANYTYTYDAASRLTAETLGGATTSYSYDATDQLTSDGTNNFTFDKNGNRTMAGYTTGTSNQLTKDGMWTYTYDAEGSLTKKSKGASAETWLYSYDNLNQLTSVKKQSTDGGTVLMQATYIYDAFANRLEKDVWTQATGTVTTRFGYDPAANGWGLADVWVDLNGSNQLQTRRVYLDGVDRAFARIDSGGTAAWYLPDRLGSVRDMVDASGIVQDHISYDSCGLVTSESNSTFGDRHKWTCRESDSETGLHFNRARYYDPKSARWLSQDPLGFTGQDANLYRYAENNQQNYVDPSGLFELKRAWELLTDDERKKYRELEKKGWKVVAATNSEGGAEWVAISLRRQNRRGGRHQGDHLYRRPPHSGRAGKDVPMKVKCCRP